MTNSWLVSLISTQKDQLLQLKISISNDKISLDLWGFVDVIQVEYIQEQGGFTRVLCPKLKKDEVIEGNFLDVFGEDLAEILKIQKSVLDSLHICGLRLDSKNKKIVERTYECLKNSLTNCRAKSCYIGFFPIDLQISSIIQLDPREVLEIKIQISDPFLIYEDFVPLLQWNEGRRLKLVLNMDILYLEQMIAIRELLTHSSTFSTVRVKYTKRVYKNLETFFAPFTPLEPNAYCFGFVLGSFRNSGIQCEKDDKLETILKSLRLDSMVPLKALGNPNIMKVISEDFDFFDIQSLRKVSRDIRDCLDYLKPDPHIHVYSILRGVCGSYDVSIYLEKNTLSRIEYRKRGHICSTMYSCTADNVANDFKVNLQHQKLRLDELSIGDDTSLIDQISEVLKSRTAPLRVKRLTMEVNRPEDLMNVLLFIDEDSLETVDINPDMNGREPQELSLDCVATSNQWKNSKNLFVNRSTVVTPIRELNINGFANLEITVKSISTEDVVYLKEELIKSSSLEKFKITFKDKTIDESLFTLMPPYRRILDVRSIWFFRMVNPEMFLHIFYHERAKQIVFLRKDRDHVPEDVIF